MSAPLTQDEILSGAQAVQDISAAMLKGAGEALKVHGDDPTAPAIVAAAFCLAVETIEKHVDPNFRKMLMLLLGGAK